ncbi:molecular chaperone HtpG [Anaerolineales bacterium HSG24]|nr:molecular chaperone HtpG [Anaerolineales bacterium HSG24]
MSTTAEATNQNVAFKAEIQQLLDILIHSLYTEKEIFLRELLSNASDALNRVQFEMLTNRDVHDAEAELRIRIDADPDNNILRITDTGIGMTAEEIEENLGTIARSGAKSFLKAMEDTGQKGAVMDDIIGQFGVGFYSVFMAAEEVNVISKSYLKDTEAVKWSSTGQGTYSISPADKAERGTTIEIKLKEETKEFAQGYKIRQIIKTYSDFVAFPIYLLEEKPPAEEEGEKTKEWTQINQQKALWRQSPREVKEETYKSFYQQFTFDFGDPLLRIHTSADAPVQFYTMLFVPSKKDYKMFGKKDEHGLKLYARKVLIQENFKELLPNYLRFVEGVVDSEDIPLNVSREAVQNTPIIKKIQKVLVRRVSSELKNLAENEPEKYITFWSEFGPFIKEGIATEPESKSKFTDLLRFQSSKAENAEDLISLADYAGRIKDDQSEIYYIIGDSYEVINRSPHLEYFKKHDIEVLFLTDPMDSFMLIGLTEYNGKSLKNIDDAGLDLPESSDKKDDDASKDGKISDDAFEALVTRFKDVLGDRVEDVKESKILTDSPTRLVNPPDAVNTNMQRVQRMLDKDFQIPKKILELNRDSSIVGSISNRLSGNGDDALINPLIEQLFENALVTEGIHPNPADMIPRLQTILEAAAKTN